MFVTLNLVRARPDPLYLLACCCTTVSVRLCAPTCHRSIIWVDARWRVVPVGCWFRPWDTKLKYGVRASVIIHDTYVYTVEEYVLILYATCLYTKRIFRRLLATLRAGNWIRERSRCGPSRVLTSPTIFDGATVKYIVPYPLLLAVLYIDLPRGLIFHTKSLAKPLKHRSTF